MTNSIESFANDFADSTLRPLELSPAVGPVLATPAYAAYATGVAVTFTLGIISDAVGYTDADDVLDGDTPEGASADQLIRARIDGLQ
ncbi:hypothetical protein ALI44B_12010 [Leifsonia sp. ALI-44-B]|jgi:hypothetical protein|uniref:hypothetical protein n=1 Tax=Leifsonia sp. ALI-44-B TaxID=1933776 RepID=UPI00097C40E5|nr:hypothetical protein [Leifsonia sp. ALI-44-B]ONI61197.1 hypothetical protein ALI44B_12010 [Leifsonia sp. ALI-44-B]